MLDDKVVLIEHLEGVKAFMILALQQQEPIHWIVEKIHFFNIKFALLGRRRDGSLNLRWKK